MFWKFSAQDIRYTGWQSGTISNIMHKICDSTVTNYISKYFSSTADIVSRASPMASRPSVCQPFFKSNRLPFIWSFWYLAWMCATIFPKKLWKYNFDFFYESLIKKQLNNGNFGGFWQFSKKNFNAGLWNLQEYYGCFQLCAKNGPCEPIFLNRSIYRSLSICWKWFQWIHSKLLEVQWSYYCKCVKARPQRVKFVGHFGPPK